jgi:hypothetical protein
MRYRWHAFQILFIAVLICNAGLVSAQLGGHNSKGDYGLQSGSQAPPGWYAVASGLVRSRPDVLPLLRRQIP